MSNPALKRLQWLLGPLLVSVAVAALEILNRVGWTAGSVAPALLVVTLVTYMWGLRSGLAGATVMAAYTIYAFGGTGLEFALPESLRRALWAIVTGYAIAALVGTMRVRETAATEHARRAERERLEATQTASRILVVANADLTQSNRALRDANATLETFSYTAAHDLRAPLRGVHSLTRFTLEDEGDRISEEGRANLRAMLVSTERMARLLDDLINLGRASNREVTLEPVELCALANETAAEVRERHPGRLVTFACHGEPVHVQGDAGLLRIVLLNLMDNAWKFTRKRDPEAHVVFGVRPPHADASDGEVIFYVRDNGAGFAPERAGDLFQEFRRLHDEREYQGTGIGLATVRRIIERHGGRVWAEGRPGHGATIYFTLSPYAARPGANSVDPLKADGETGAVEVPRRLQPHDPPAPLVERSDR